MRNAAEQQVKLQHSQNTFSYITVIIILPKFSILFRVDRLRNYVTANRVKSESQVGKKVLKFYDYIQPKVAKSDILQRL